MDTIEYKGFPKPKTVKLSKYEKAKQRKGTLTLKKLKELHKKVQEAAGPTKESDGTIWIPKYPRVAPKVKRKAKRAKLPSIKKLVLKADSVFAKYIRLRGENKCVLCGSTNNPTCGHLIKRGKKPTRYSEINCNVLCMGCNYKDNFEHDHYVMWFIKQYGVEKYEMLIELSKEFHKWTRDELLEIISMYDIKKP